MNERLAVLLVGNLSESLRLRSIWTANSEPHWLCMDQYTEHAGEVQFFPARAQHLMVYAAEHGLDLIGIVRVTASGDYREYFNEKIVEPTHRNFVKKLFQAHACFW